MTRYEYCLKFVGTAEGGFGDDPDDRGNWTGGQVGTGVLKGTKYGISAAAYPEEDIRNLTPERAAFLYRKDYWEPCRCGDLAKGLDLLVFDAAVNHGCRRASVFLQQTIGRLMISDLSCDGVIGPITMSETQHAIDRLGLRAVMGSYLLTRVAYYSDLLSGDPKTDRDYKYIRGWLHRISGLRNTVGL